jgi:hypothetical protein
MLFDQLGAAWVASLRLVRPWDDIGKIVDAGKAVGQWAFGAAKDAVAAGAQFVRKGAATAIFGPIATAADGLINLIPAGPFRDTARSIKDRIYNWVRGVDQGLPDADVVGDMIGVGSGAVRGNGSLLNNHRGSGRPGRWQQIVDYLEESAPGVRSELPLTGVLGP